jgi:hypothetical protein
MAAKTQQEALSEITDSAKRQRKSVRQFFRAFPEIPGIVADYDEHATISAWFGCLYGGSFTISLRSLDGFKGDDLLDILFRVETLFTVELEMKDEPHYSRKVFSAIKPWEHGTLHISINAELKPQSSECRRVQVGVTKEFVETPVYELQCTEVSA